MRRRVWGINGHKMDEPPPNDEDRLKKAEIEIRRILKRYDVGAAVTLVSDADSRFFYYLIPSWSVIRVRGLKHGIRTRRNEYISNGDKQRCLDLSVHMICEINELNAKAVHDMQTIIDILGQHFELDQECVKDLRRLNISQTEPPPG